MNERDRTLVEARWSDEDQQWVGTCTAFPSLSWLADSEAEAMAGIMSLVAEELRLD